MSKSSAKNEPTGYPEFGVRKEIICSFFTPPMPSSTFHDRVNDGIIVPIKGMRGFYKLNDSLRRLGLREVPKPPQDVPTRTTEDIIRLAFHLIDPDLFPAPVWLGKAEVIAAADFHHAELVASQHSANLAEMPELDHDRLKMNYLQGVIDIADIAQGDGQATTG